MFGLSVKSLFSRLQFFSSQKKGPNTPSEIIDERKGPNTPSEIIDNFLFLSDITFVQHKHLQKYDVAFVCSITPSALMGEIEPAIMRKVIPLNDMSSAPIVLHFEEAHIFIEEARAANKKIVVHCEVGMSRSPTIVISYLMKHKNMSLREAYHHVKQRRPIIMPNMGFIKQLLVYEKMLYGKEDTLFFAEYMREVYKLDYPVEEIQKSLVDNNLDINDTMMQLFDNT